MWGNELKSKPEAERISMKVRAEAATFNQTKVRFLYEYKQYIIKHSLSREASIKCWIHKYIKIFFSLTAILMNFKYC